jgi:hypothetical protein
MDRLIVSPLATNHLFGGAKWQLRIINAWVGGVEPTKATIFLAVNGLLSLSLPKSTIWNVIAEIDDPSFRYRHDLHILLLETFSAENQKVFGQTLFLLSSTHRDHLETLSQMIPL